MASKRAQGTARNISVQARIGGAAYVNTGYTRRNGGMYTRLTRVDRNAQVKSRKLRGSGASGG